MPACSATRNLTFDGEPDRRVVPLDHVDVGRVGAVGDAEVEQRHPGQPGIALLDQPVKPRRGPVTAGRIDPRLRARPGGVRRPDRLHDVVALLSSIRPRLVNVVVVALLPVQRIAGRRVRAQLGAVDEHQRLGAGGLARGAGDQLAQRRGGHGLGQLPPLLAGVLTGLRGVPGAGAVTHQAPLHGLRQHQRRLARLPRHGDDDSE
jgi:hypothetical protein